MKTNPTVKASWLKLRPTSTWTGAGLHLSFPSMCLCLRFSTAQSKSSAIWKGDSWLSMPKSRKLCGASQWWWYSSSYASCRATSHRCWYGSWPREHPKPSMTLRSVLPWKIWPPPFTWPSVWPISIACWTLWSTTSPAQPSRMSAGKLFICPKNTVLTVQRGKLGRRLPSLSASCDNTAIIMRQADKQNIQIFCATFLLKLSHPYDYWIFLLYWRIFALF